MDRSVSGVSAIFASTSRSPAALSLAARARPSAPWRAPSSRPVLGRKEPFILLLVTAVRLGDLRVPLVAVLLSATTNTSGRLSVVLDPWSWSSDTPLAAFLPLVLLSPWAVFDR